jgi:hypothetical protein
MMGKDGNGMQSVSCDAKIWLGRWRENADGMGNQNNNHSL